MTTCVDSGPTTLLTLGGVQKTHTPKGRYQTSNLHSIPIFRHTTSILYRPSIPPPSITSHRYTTLTLLPVNPPSPFPSKSPNTPNSSPENSRKPAHAPTPLYDNPDASTLPEKVARSDSEPVASSVSSTLPYIRIISPSPP